jgi:transcriptional regulator of acetoin/glycerol metabolism
MALDALAESRDRFAPLLAPGAPFDAFATAMADAGFCGIFCDARGVVVARRISEPLDTAIARTRLVEGAVWSEGARGTNGVGTALVERSPVAVVGAEHYELRNHMLACYASPVRDIRARTVAVLDASGPATSGASFVHASVAATAAAIEALIVARTYDAAMPGGLFELERLLARLPYASFVLEATGHLRRSNDRFRSLVGGTGQAALVRAARSLFGVGARSGAVSADELPSALRGLAVELEPIGNPEDPFGALVHLHPRPTARRAAPEVARRPPAFDAIFGEDPEFVAAREQAARFARSDLPILLLAETGAGKEVFARAIHASSLQADGPFVAVNCGGLTGSLLESELFGYGPGSFTGAAPSGREGKLAAADRGTLFLDEIGEMSASAQATLLRFLEDGTFYRVGEAIERRADVRLVAATSRDLPALVRACQFRSDLYFRMRGVVLRLPPLRERSDRLELARVLLERLAVARNSPKPMGFSPAALAWMEHHPWPGNVRELRSALNYAIVLAEDHPRIELWHLPIEQGIAQTELGDQRAAAERAALLRALGQAGGNLSRAARSLGVARSTLYRMLVRHQLRPRETGPAR